jgi:ankyrin repeat protein
MLAAYSNRVEIAQLLIRHGADVHAVNIYRQTALIAASLRQHSSTVHCLLDAGADVNAV